MGCTYANIKYLQASANLCVCHYPWATHINSQVWILQMQINQICISKEKEAVTEKQSEEAAHTNQGQKTTQHND